MFCLILYLSFIHVICGSKISSALISEQLHLTTPKFLEYTLQAGVPRSVPDDPYRRPRLRTEASTKDWFLFRYFDDSDCKDDNIVYMLGYPSGTCISFFSETPGSINSVEYDCRNGAAVFRTFTDRDCSVTNQRLDYEFNQCLSVSEQSLSYTCEEGDEDFPVEILPKSRKYLMYRGYEDGGNDCDGGSVTFGFAYVIGKCNLFFKYTSKPAIEVYSKTDCEGSKETIDLDFDCDSVSTTRRLQASSNIHLSADDDDDKDNSIRYELYNDKKDKDEVFPVYAIVLITVCGFCCCAGGIGTFVWWWFFHKSSAAIKVTKVAVESGETDGVNNEGPNVAQDGSGDSPK